MVYFTQFSVFLWIRPDPRFPIPVLSQLSSGCPVMLSQFTVVRLSQFIQAKIDDLHLSFVITLFPSLCSRDGSEGSENVYSLLKHCDLSDRIRYARLIPDKWLYQLFQVRFIPMYYSSSCRFRFRFPSSTEFTPLFSTGVTFDQSHIVHAWSVLSLFQFLCVTFLFRFSDKWS